MKIIDPHLHLFDLELGVYDWLKSDNPPFWPDKAIINKNFTEDHLKLSHSQELVGFIHIEAGFNNQQPWQEIQWLEEYCQLPFRAIGGINLLLDHADFLASIKQLKTYQSVVGVREILDEHALTYLTKKEVITNLFTLAENGLIFELQMSIENIEAVKQLAKILTTIPQLKIVVNHAGWPPLQLDEINKSLINDWYDGLAILSQHQQCFIKCSGFEMIDRNYSENWQCNIIKSCISTFGIERVMLASNFPLCLFSTSYQNYWQNYQSSSTFSKQELSFLCYENAKAIYRL